MKNKRYFYPLYKEQDKKLFELLIDSVYKNKFPGIKGGEQDLISFVKLLISSQKMKDYRKFWDELINSYKSFSFDLYHLNDFGSKIEVAKGVDESWAVFHQDKEICNEIDIIIELDIDRLANSEMAGEFITRFLLTQLLFDWRGPLLATCVTITESNEINFANLNEILKTWDLAKIWSI